MGHSFTAMGARDAQNAFIVLKSNPALSVHLSIVRNPACFPSSIMSHSTDTVDFGDMYHHQPVIDWSP